MRNPLKRDPSRTTSLRKRYMADMKRRFSKVSRAIQELIVKDDALGLITSVPVTFQQQVSKQAWRFKSDANKVKEYRKWLQQQIDAKILTVHAISGQPWTATYAESAYRKGMTKAYTQVHKQALAGDVAFYEGGKAQFLREAFASPISLSKIELIYTRAFDELKGVTAAMGQQMSRILTNGMIKGDGPRTIARELRKNVATITKTRAIVIARTEVIYAHAEGQLDSFERLGVKELGLMAEWMTAGDSRVCENCGALEGHIFTVEEARGMLPLHPNCRCIWTPYLKGISKRKTRKEIRERLKTAIPRWPSTKRKIKAKEAKEISAKAEKVAYEKLRISDKFVVEKYNPTEYGLNVYNKAIRFDSPDGIQVLRFNNISKERVYKDIVKNRGLIEKSIPTIEKYFGEKASEAVKLKRLRLHDSIVNKMLNAVKPERRYPPQVLMTGGYPGSGKSTMLDSAFPGWRKNYIHIDSDKIKDGRNILYDGTMWNQEKMNKLVASFTKKGFDIYIAYADLPLEKSMYRSISRMYSSTGRFVEPMLQASHGVKNITTFENLKLKVKGWSHYDTDVLRGAKPVLIDSGGVI